MGLPQRQFVALVLIVGIGERVLRDLRNAVPAASPDTQRNGYDGPMLRFLLLEMGTETRLVYATWQLWKIALFIPGLTMLASLVFRGIGEPTLAALPYLAAALEVTSAAVHAHLALHPRDIDDLSRLGSLLVTLKFRLDVLVLVALLGSILLRLKRPPPNLLPPPEDEKIKAS